MKKEKEKKICSVEGCDRLMKAQGYCATHYTQVKKYGKITNIEIKKIKNRQENPCLVEGCEDKQYSKGYCRVHYERWRKHGDPLMIKKIEILERTCQVGGCNEKYYANGYCQKHNTQVKRHGRIIDDEVEAKKAEEKMHRDEGCQVAGCEEKYHAKGHCARHYSQIKNHGGIIDDEIAAKSNKGKTCKVEGCEKPACAKGYCHTHRWQIKTHGEIIDHRPDLISIGERFGRLIVLRKLEEKATNGGTLWECRCDCKKITVVSTSSLRSGGTRSCGCLHAETLSNMAMEKALLFKEVVFERLTALEPTDERSKNGDIMWWCQCSCPRGTIILVSLDDLKTGHTKSCGCLQDEMYEARKLPWGEGARNSVLWHYKKNAENRCLEWKLTDEDFDRLTQGNCFHCGTRPRNMYSREKGNGAFIYSGIDRLDNTQGYNLGNCVSSCFPCNRSKLDMPYKDFVGWIIRTFKHMEPNFARGLVKRVLAEQEAEILAWEEEKTTKLEVFVSKFDNAREHNLDPRNLDLFGWKEEREKIITLRGDEHAD